MPVDKSVSKFVREILNQDPSLVHELQQRKTAQREIAKKIKDQLIGELKFPDKDPIKLEGNVAVAITRYLKKLREQQEELLGIKKVQELLKEGTTEVTDGLKHYKVLFHENTDVLEVIKVILSQLNRGDISSISVKPHGVELYVKKMSENGFLKKINDQTGAKVTKLHDSLSQVKLVLPKQAAEIPGILAHVSSLLADQAISIFDTMVLHSENLVIVFVINELHASKARDILLKLNNENSTN
ncbi:MAG: ACT domain-containing protein [Candidatus Heimdallarchaeota archaeon]|nr:ACT domain-containing protein [Candidatus Heimdallarchaeota archaeon]